MANSTMVCRTSQTAIVSITAPGTRIYEGNSTKSRRLARQLNEFAANLIQKYPKKFGFCATLPSFIDVEGVIEEINHTHSVFKPDGFIVYTSYGKGQYLGHPSFLPIWKKFNELQTVAFIHPSEAPTPIGNRYAPYNHYT
ncbi:unnamed protein product [Adineta ricciae]|uniref:2-amino-3-carboxymuconate-6-semialdehyde decarboxylase n=1 Tax=Adineta ricciae TaxID=249248 RepID=A0A814Y2D3_ADIRI|nr:unnamed protein product [Adineta ricciae]CAF1377661.1 unnamed protein product [Adineta ricciae]